VEMRLELKRLQNEVGIAFVFVTHDQEEALTMADRAAVMKAGKVMQIGTPEQLYNAPANLYVARFIGEANVFSGRLENGADGWLVNANGNSYRVSEAEVQRTALGRGAKVAIVVRPERMMIQPCESDRASQPLNLVYGRLLESAYLGNARTFIVQTEDDQRLSIQTPAADFAPSLSIGQQVCIGWKIESGILVPASENGDSKGED